MAGKKIGILAMQGAFIEHENAVRRCGAEAVQIRTREELNQVDALIIPGGESTTIGKLLHKFELDEDIKKQSQAGMPIWGTCAGMILLAKEIVGFDQPRLELMNIRVIRNGFGRQVDSFETELEIDNLGTSQGVFIRAPYVEKVWGGAEVLSKFDDRIVMVQQGKLLATAFHPELTPDLSIHNYFIKMA
ncbi:MAG: pyridoxal 5'-phosphate synthase glutaminase subunit PdxT [Methylocystaceae bacterium]